MKTYKTTENAEEIHEELLTDLTHHYYAILWIGFGPKKRFIHQMLVHFQIKNTGEIWILANYTEFFVLKKCDSIRILPQVNTVDLQ
jgi:hypothetical protein